MAFDQGAIAERAFEIIRERGFGVACDECKERLYPGDTILMHSDATGLNAEPGERAFLHRITIVIHCAACGTMEAALRDQPIIDRT